MMTMQTEVSAGSVELKPCPFCGSKIKHVKSWAKSFNPPRLYHEWHHEDINPDCQIFRFNGKIVASATDDEEMQRYAIARWNARVIPDAAQSSMERIPIDKLAKHFKVSIERAQAAQDDLGFMYREVASPAQTGVSSVVVKNELK